MDLCNLRCLRKEKLAFAFLLCLNFMVARICIHVCFCLESELRAGIRWLLLRLDSSSKFSRFLASPDNRADCCPCTDCQVERGATLSRRFSARRPHPAPASPPPAPRPRANPFISSFQFTNPPPLTRVTCRPRLLLPGYLRARRLDKSAPLGETCKACDSI